MKEGESRWTLLEEDVELTVVMSFISTSNTTKYEKVSKCVRVALEKTTQT